MCPVKSDCHSGEGNQSCVTKAHLKNVFLNNDLSKKPEENVQIFQLELNPNTPEKWRCAPLPPQP